MKWRGLRKEKARVGVCCEGNKYVEEKREVFNVS